jgi:hypothetical protein
VPSSLSLFSVCACFVRPPHRPSVCGPERPLPFAGPSSVFSAVCCCVLCSRASTQPALPCQGLAQSTVAAAFHWPCFRFWSSTHVLVLDDRRQNYHIAVCSHSARRRRAHWRCVWSACAVPFGLRGELRCSSRSSRAVLLAALGARCTQTAQGGGEVLRRSPPASVPRVATTPHHCPLILTPLPVRVSRCVSVCLGVSRCLH